MLFENSITALLKVSPPSICILKSAPQTDHTVFNVNSNATNWTSLDLYKEIVGSTENSLFGKTYIIGTATSLSANPATFTKGLITTNVLTTTVSANGGTYKLWIY